jgi:osmotically-inducible protein OsmY
LWSDPRLARRRIDVDEIEEGHIELAGTVRSDAERELAVDIAESVNGVVRVIDALEVVPHQKKRHRA